MIFLAALTLLIGSVILAISSSVVDQRHPPLAPPLSRNLTRDLTPGLQVSDHPADLRFEALIGSQYDPEYERALSDRRRAQSISTLLAYLAIITLISAIIAAGIGFVTLTS